MNIDDWRRIKRNTSRYLHDLEAWVQEFIPWHIQSGHEPALILPSVDEDLALQMAIALARRMVTGVAVTNARSWREAARKSMKGKRVFEALKSELTGPVGQRFDELIEQNARKIVTLSEELSGHVSRYISRQQQRGVRASEIAETLERKIPQLKRWQIKRLARTEVSASETAVTRVRAENLGLRWYEWATSEDQRVRKAHRLLDKVLVAWSDPPAPEQLAGIPSHLGHYHAGAAPNCRCVTLPLISMDEIRWPHRIYEHGRIEWMSRADFQRWNGVPQAA